MSKQISLTLSDELFNEYKILSGEKRGAVQRQIRALMKERIYALRYGGQKKTDTWLPISELRKDKHNISLQPIYPTNVMGDLMSELKTVLGISEENRATIKQMRDEQKKYLSALDAPDPP